MTPHVAIISAALPSGVSFAEKLIIPALGVIALLVVTHFVAAMAYARRIATRARSELRAGHERTARSIILGIDAGFFGNTAYRFLPQDLRDRFQSAHHRPNP